MLARQKYDVIFTNQNASTVTLFWWCDVSTLLCRLVCDVSKE